MEQDKPKRYKDTLIFPAALDPDAVKIIRRLRKYGHTTYLVGGCVRDMLLGSIPKDFDIATSARPRQVRRLFKNSKVIGRRFKLVHVIFRDKFIEVSTFRQSPDLENNYFKSDGLLIVRDNVYGNERDDALRRDFTLNALFFDIEKEEVIDFTHGVKDLEKRMIRTIGDPHIRFQEDPVRILRAIRFSCRLNLEIDPEVFDAMRTYTPEISKSAPQRVTEEIIRLMACGASRKALEMILELGLFEILLPEVYRVLDEEAHYFEFEECGKDFLLRLAGIMDQKDKGRRIFDNPMYLALLFCHLGGTAVHQALSSQDQPRDPGMVLNNVLRPMAVHMGISRRDFSRIKQILIAYIKLANPKKRRRLRPRDLVRRDYFPDALEFFRQVLEAKGESMDRYAWWEARRAEFKGGETGRGRAKPTGKSRSRRRRRPRKPRDKGKDS